MSSPDVLTGDPRFVGVMLLSIDSTSSRFGAEMKHLVDVLVDRIDRSGMSVERAGSR